MEKYIVLQGYYDCYAISDLGNVKNLRTGKVLKNTLGKDGYYSVLLSKDGKKMRIRNHRLVAIYHLDKVEKKDDVNHKDGIKTNNSKNNLEWCNKSENMKHAHEKELFNKEYRNVEVYDFETKEHLFTFESVKQCSKLLNLNQSPIYRVLKGKNKRHHNFIFKYADRI